MSDNTSKRKPMIRVLLPCLLAILFAAPLLHSEEVIVIRVIDEVALARLRPDPGSQVIKEFPLGARLEARTKTGDWFEIAYTDDSGYAITAYIHSGSVEVIDEGVAPPPEAFEEAVPRDTPALKDEAGGILNGFSLKFGVTDKGWGDWIGSLGFTFRLHKNISLGLEVMPSYNSLKDESEDVEVNTIHAFTLLNVRGGTSLYFIDPDMDFFKFYAGLGGGMALGYTNSSLEGSSSSLFKANPALQILGGIELDTGKVSLIFEYQMLRELDKDIDPGGWLGYIIFGIRF